MLNLPGSCDSSLCLDYFAAAQAGRADAYMLRRRSNFGVNRPQIDVPAAFAHVVGVADGASKLRALAADITNSCHNLLPSEIVAELYFTRIVFEMPEKHFSQRSGIPPLPVYWNQDFSGTIPRGPTKQAA